MDTLKLKVLSQEKQLVDASVESVTAPTTSGEITILPNHIPLLSSLQTGVLIYRTGKEESSIVISKGFLDMSTDNTLTIMVDSATQARDISVEKAQAAIQAAKEVMAASSDRRELILAEASLKQAMWEIKVAQKTSRQKV